VKTDLTRSTPVGTVLMQVGTNATMYDVLGDVRLTGGIADNVGQAEVFDGSTWRPICAHMFHNNDNGYEIVCAKLGMSGGVFVRHFYNSATVAYYVGSCSSTTVPTWPTCDTAYAGGNCAQGGGNPGVEIQCTTPSPTPAPATPSPPVSATGDPHLQNIRGERFDLLKSGKHILIHIPRGERADTALLRVAAEARLLGEGCADMYFQNVNITGSWAEAKHAGGYTFVSGSAADAAPQWLSLGPIGMKVAHGHTSAGIHYLNVYVRSLGQAGHPVGGLLGEDDHAEEATPPAECLHKVRLAAAADGQNPGGHRVVPSSVASASP